ncbi:MAG: MATE family efflux transporter [Lachnospiraceae bacterium]|nr:MATE family efflux transporter [Lachnospiraceae bacterium]
MNGKPMTEGQPWKHIIKFAFPVLIGSLLQQLYNTVDTIIVGRYASEEALSAVGTTGTITFFFLAIAMGISSGNGVVIAQNYGIGDEKAVRKNASAGILFLMLLGAIATVLGIVFAYPVFKYLMAVPGEILPLTVQYFMVYSVGLLFQYGYNSLSAILRAVGDSSATLYFLLISSVANVALDLLFVAAFKWGVIGAAVATVISQFGALAAAFVYMRAKYPIFVFKMSEYKLDKAAIMQTVKIGFPISLQLIIVSVGLTFIQRAVNEFGKVMTASFTVGNRIEQYINLPCNALQTTLATFTGQNIGANRLDRVKKGAKQTVLISLVTTIVISTLIWVFADKIAGLFELSEASMVYCLPHIKTVAIVNLVLSMYVPLFGVFQGTGHSGFPTIVATSALSVRVFVTYLLRYSSFLGYQIIWWNGLFGFGMGFMVTWSFYISGKWQIKDSEVHKQS